MIRLNAMCSLIYIVEYIILNIDLGLGLSICVYIVSKNEMIWYSYA